MCNVIYITSSAIILQQIDYQSSMFYTLNLYNVTHQIYSIKKYFFQKFQKSQIFIKLLTSFMFGLTIFFFHIKGVISLFLMYADIKLSFP